MGYTQCHFFAGIGGWSYALRLAGWPTPNAMDSMTIRSDEALMRAKKNGGCSNIKDVVPVAAWATPRANDAKKQGNISTDKRNGLPAKVLKPGMRVNQYGQELTGFSDATTSGGQLNPELSRWLMGYPEGWELCRPTETRLSRRSRQK